MFDSFVVVVSVEQSIMSQCCQFWLTWFAPLAPSLFSVRHISVSGSGPVRKIGVTSGSKSSRDGITGYVSQRAKCRKSLWDIRQPVQEKPLNRTLQDCLSKPNSSVTAPYDSNMGAIDLRGWSGRTREMRITFNCLWCFCFSFFVSSILVQSPRFAIFYDQSAIKACDFVQGSAHYLLGNYRVGGTRCYDIIFRDSLEVTVDAAANWRAKDK